MYARVTRSGGRSYLQIVESHRVGKSVRQRVIANLGRLDTLEPNGLDALIKGLNRAVGRIDPEQDAVEYESARAFGDVYALHQIWGSLGLDQAIRAALRSSRRVFDAEAMVRAMVFNRLCAPDSKLGCLEWLDTVSIPGMPKSVQHDHLLRTMDALMDRWEKVQSRVDGLLRPMLDQQLSIVFYDLTTVRIHGEGQVEGDLRAFGLNKETGGIARQFVLGVVQTADGLPLMHTVHAGNIAETKTLVGLLESVLKRFPIQRVVIVADRGLLSLDNLATLERLGEESGRRLQFILAVPARRYHELGDTLESLQYTDGLAENMFAGHRLIVAHSAERAEEQSARRRARIAELESFAERMVSKLDAQDAGQTATGRRASDRGAYSRFQRAISEAELTRFVQADFNADQFSYSINDAAIAAAERYDGKLVLLTNVEDMTPSEVYHRYKSLADIERGFRVLKSDIQIAPVHHRLPDRIRAHALICFLALLLHRVMRMRLKEHGSALSPTKALALLRKIQTHQAKVGANTLTGISRTTPQQHDLFEALQLPIPDRAPV